jgi:hypothetical protein
MVDEVELEFLSEFPLLIIIPPLLQNYPSTGPVEVYGNPDEAAHYHILCL